jgi:hypothetical protein
MDLLFSLFFFLIFFPLTFRFPLHPTLIAVPIPHLHLQYLLLKTSDH